MWHRVWSGPVLSPPPPGLAVSSVPLSARSSHVAPLGPLQAPQAPSCLDLRCAVHLPGPSPSQHASRLLPSLHLISLPVSSTGVVCVPGTSFGPWLTLQSLESLPLWAGASPSSHCTGLPCQAGCSTELFPAAASTHRAGVGLGRHAGHMLARRLGKSSLPPSEVLTLCQALPRVLLCLVLRFTLISPRGPCSMCQPAVAQER